MTDRITPPDDPDHLARLMLIRRRGACRPPLGATPAERRAHVGYWWPHDDAHEARGKVVCLTMCPVRVECLAHALRYEDGGTWGGLTAHERRRMRRAAKVSA